MGKNITLVGGNGDGQTTKVANQIIVGLTLRRWPTLLFASKPVPIRRKCGRR